MMENLAQILLLLSVAIAVVVTFQRLHIPTSLGYLLVGVALGPYTMGPTVSMPELAGLAEFHALHLEGKDLYDLQGSKATIVAGLQEVLAGYR